MRTAVALVVLLLASVVAAQPNPDAARLFDEGRALAQTGNYDAACEKFALSFELDNALGTELNLADCHEHLGHYLDAWRRFDHAATHAEAAGETARATLAHDRANKLIANRLATVVIELGTHAGEAKVIIADQLVPSRRTIEHHFEPGTLAVEITAAGRKPFRWSRPVVAGERARLDPHWDTPEVDAPETNHASLWRDVGWVGATATLFSIGAYVYGYTKVAPYQNTTEVLTMPNGAFYPNTFDDSQCDTALGREARGVDTTNNHRFDDACTGKSIISVAVPLTLVFAVVSVTGFVVGHVEAGRAQTPNVAIVPLIDRTSAGGAITLRW